MKDQDHADGWCCSDCIMLLANGETPPELNEDETAAYLARIDDEGECSIGRMYGGDGCDCAPDDDERDDEHHAEVCERMEFSWSRCDVCGSTLGGERNAVTFWFHSVPES